jgi:hypothetical protein
MVTSGDVSGARMFRGRAWQVPRVAAALAAALTLAAALAVGACGGGGGTPGTSAASSRSASTAGTPTTSVGTATSRPGATAQPHPTESNPPGDIPDSQVYVPYTPVGGHLTVKVPEGWARTVTGAVVTFTDKLNTIRISQRPAGTAPTPTTVRAQDVPRLQAQVPKFVLGRIGTTSRTAGRAVLLTYQGDSAPNAVTGKVVRDAFEQYVFFHAGTRVDLTLSGPVNADNVDPWRTVTDSLRWL